MDEPYYMQRMQPVDWWQTLYDGRTDTLTVRDYDAGPAGKILLTVSNGNGSNQWKGEMNLIAKLAASAPYMRSMLECIGQHLMHHPDALPPELLTAYEREMQYVRGFYLRPPRPELPRREENDG